MSKEPFYRESEESWAERHKQIALESGQEICDCGRVTEPEERHKCVQCGQEGCVHCMRLAATSDADLNNDWVCGDDCEIKWLKSLAAMNKRDHRSYQGWIAKLIEAVRLRKAG